MVSDIERKDPVGEELDMVVPGVVHRYPDRVLFLVTDRCASYCRYCTRSRMVSNAQDYGFSPSLQAGLEYIKSNTAIRDVLLGGGDPLLLSDEKLAFYSPLCPKSHMLNSFESAQGFLFFFLNGLPKA